MAKRQVEVDESTIVISDAEEASATLDDVDTELNAAITEIDDGGYAEALDIVNRCLTDLAQVRDWLEAQSK